MLAAIEENEDTLEVETSGRPRAYCERKNVDGLTEEGLASHSTRSQKDSILTNTIRTIPPELSQHNPVYITRTPNAKRLIRQIRLDSLTLSHDLEPKEDS